LSLRSSLPLLVNTPTLQRRLSAIAELLVLYFTIEFVVMNLKFEVCSCSHSRGEGSQNFKSRSRLLIRTFSSRVHICVGIGEICESWFQARRRLLARGRCASWEIQHYFPYTNLRGGPMNPCLSEMEGPNYNKFWDDIQPSSLHSKFVLCQYATSFRNGSPLKSKIRPNFDICNPRL